MLPYFPFDQDRFAMALGVRALRPEEPLIQVDEAHYLAELRLKAALLEEARHTRFLALPGTEPQQWETLTQVLPLMAEQHPRHFSLEREGAWWSWENRLAGTRARFVPGEEGGLPQAPLDWLGRQVQEDLLVMDGTREGLPLVAGQLCFPSGWCLEEKMGRAVLDIHGPVPHFGEALGGSTVKLMKGLKPGRPVTRVNWAFTVTDQLDLAPWTRPGWQHQLREITPANAGERCYLRLERQTLSLMPRTGAILFTIHTYRSPVAREVEEPERRQRLTAVLRTMPADTGRYKGIAPYLPALLAWLESGAA